MPDIGSAFAMAFDLIFSLDDDLVEIIGLSLRISLTAVAISCVIGLPLGGFLAIARFPGRNIVLVFVNALMGLPPVVVGLIVYLYLSSSGPFGWLQILYTPAAMIIAQTLLIAPIVTALTRQVVEDLNGEYEEQFQSLGLTRGGQIKALLFDARFSLLTVALAGFGRAIAEVGAVIIVGGNINHLTRVMTTAIALETSKGNLGQALALGIILLTLALIVNALVMSLRAGASRQAYA